MQRVHFQVRSSRCFQWSTNIDKDFCRYLWYCGKKRNRMSFSVALVKFHLFGTNWHVFIQNLSFVYYYSENSATSRIWKVLPNMVFPPIWGKKMAAFWACACKLSWTLFSPARVQPLCGAGREFRDWTSVNFELFLKGTSPRLVEDCWVFVF